MFRNMSRSPGAATILPCDHYAGKLTNSKSQNMGVTIVLVNTVMNNYVPQMSVVLLNVC